MKINEKGLAIIKQFEGCRLKVYKCPAGYDTIGYGHRILALLDKREITQLEADELLKWDCEYFEKKILDNQRVILNNNQFSALVSLAFNIGETNLFKSHLWEYVQKSEFEEASKEFTKHSRARVNKILVVLQGLLKRRKKEMELFVEAV